MDWKRLLFSFISKRRTYSEETVVPGTSTSSDHLFKSSATLPSSSSAFPSTPFIKSIQKKMCEMYSFLRLKDPALQEAYQAFNEDNLNLSSLLTPAILTISIIIPLYIIYGGNLNRLGDSTFGLISCIVVFTTMNGLLVDAYDRMLVNVIEMMVLSIHGIVTL
eukprot:gene10080-11156_t